MRRSTLLPGLLFGLLVLIFLSSPSYAKVDRKKVITKLSFISVPFIENRGQVSKEVAFYAKTLSGNVFVTKDGRLVYTFAFYENPRGKLLTGGREKYSKFKRAVLTEELLGAKIKGVRGTEFSHTKVSFFIGNDRKKWKRNLKTYKEISLGEVYEGIELRLRAYGKRVEKIFEVSPGVDPSIIKLVIKGVHNIIIRNMGDIELNTTLGTVILTKPIAYQDINGKKWK